MAPGDISLPNWVCNKEVIPTESVALGRQIGIPTAYEAESDAIHYLWAYMVEYAKIYTPRNCEPGRYQFAGFDIFDHSKDPPVLKDRLGTLKILMDRIESFEKSNQGSQAIDNSQRIADTKATPSKSTHFIQNPVHISPYFKSVTSTESSTPKSSPKRTRTTDNSEANHRYSLRSTKKSRTELVWTDIKTSDKPPKTRSRSQQAKPQPITLQSKGKPSNQAYTFKEAKTAGQSYSSLAKLQSESEEVEDRDSNIRAKATFGSPTPRIKKAKSKALLKYGESQPTTMSVQTQSIVQHGVTPVAEKHADTKRAGHQATSLIANPKSMAELANSTDLSEEEQSDCGAEEYDGPNFITPLDRILERGRQWYAEMEPHREAWLAYKATAPTGVDVFSFGKFMELRLKAQEGVGTVADDGKADDGN
jgi:hypothetical protein